MSIKLEVQNASIQVTSTCVEDGIIPSNLAKLTETVIGLHKANGDLAWISDLINDATRSKHAILDYSFGPDEGEIINRYTDAQKQPQ